MPSILLAWELGQNFGHVGRLITLAQALKERGAKTMLVLRSLDAAKALNFTDDCPCVQAPIQSELPPHVFREPASFAHILHNTCFGILEPLLARIQRWHQLFQEHKPDLIVCDHSPTALLAARTYGLPTVCVGTGFSCPPPVDPMPEWRNLSGDSAGELARDEQQVLELVNRVLKSYGRNELDFLAALYGTRNKCLLMTYAEFDHFGARDGATYWGIPLPNTGEPLPWPNSRGRRVFAYLRPCPVLHAICLAMDRWQLSCVLYCPGLKEEYQKNLASPYIKFMERPADLTAVAAECDLFIGNGSHFTAVHMLLAGKPVLLLPKWVEQALFSQCVQKLGAGRIASPRNPRQAVEALQFILNVRTLRERAEALASKYQHHDRREVSGGLAEYLISKVNS